MTSSCWPAAAGADLAPLAQTWRPARPGAPAGRHDLRNLARHGLAVDRSARLGCGLAGSRSGLGPAGGRSGLGLADRRGHLGPADRRRWRLGSGRAHRRQGLGDARHRRRRPRRRGGQRDHRRRFGRPDDRGRPIGRGLRIANPGRRRQRLSTRLGARRHGGPSLARRGWRRRRLGVGHQGAAWTPARCPRSPRRASGGRPRASRAARAP